MSPLTKKKIRIAIIGTRGIPANYGGFETCVEEVGQRLVIKRQNVTVYCRKSYYKERHNKYLGINLIYLPNLKKKSFDTMSHTFLSVCHALFNRYDVYMVFNSANSPLVLPLRILGKKIIINTDGLEWKRSKWGLWGKTYYRISEKFACFFANRLVSDSNGIKNYYQNTHYTDSTKIAYGAYVQNCKKAKLLSQFGIEPNKYFLQITRFEPENNPLLTIRAFKRLNTTKKLVIIGGNPYPTEYTKQIELEGKGSIILPGFIYNQDLLKELWCFCFAYIHGNEVGGTNPALLQTMASGCFTIARDVTFNQDVLSNCGIYFKKDIDSLAEKMRWALDNEGKLANFKEKARARILEHYSWDRIADQYEQLFYDIINGKYPWKPKITQLFH